MILWDQWQHTFEIGISFTIGAKRTPYPLRAPEVSRIYLLVRDILALTFSEPEIAV